MFITVKLLELRLYIVKYYINKHDVTGLHWSTELQSSCKHPHRCNQIHLKMMSTFTLLLVFVVYLVTKRKVCNI